MLKVKNLEVGYNGLKVLFDISLYVKEGEVVTIIGSNGGGKTTLLKSISGLLRPTKGRIQFFDQDIIDMPAHQRVNLGISYLPCEREVFPYMTILENLELGCFYGKGKQKKKELFEWMFQMFPVLYERRYQLAGTLSGGERRMLSLSRGLISGSKLLLLDEPSFGLAPKVVSQYFDILEEINKKGISILLTEQKARYALKFANRAYLLNNGRIELEGTASELLENDYVEHAYLGLN